MANRFANNASSTLALPITDIAQTIINLDGGGVNFPTLSGGATFQLVIEDSLGTYEICTCTARVGDQMTIVRAQEGTIAQTFAAGARVELRLTKAVMDNFAQLDGFTMQGDINMNGYVLSNVSFTGATITGGTAVGTVIRAADNGETNELVVNNGGAGVSIGGNLIWHAGNDGPDSLLNADLLDGFEATYLLDWPNFTNVPATFAPSAHTHTAAEITDTIPAVALEANVVRQETETSGVIRIVTAAPADVDGANGDIWLVVPA